MKTLILPVLICLITVNITKVEAQNFNTATIDTVANYVASLQYTNNSLPSYGAIKKTTVSGVFNGISYFSIEPYFNHIACLGILQSNLNTKCDVAKHWMTWYLNHLNNKGQTLNHYYKADGSGETTCPNGSTGSYCNNIDAEDSDPALFWMLARRYFIKTNDLSFFTPTVKVKLETAAQFLIDSLIQPDHLSIAKRNYAIKYTMDNSEVYQGLLSLSYIENSIYGDVTKANYYLSKANLTKTAIKTLLYNSTNNLYNHYLGGITDSTQWYQSGVAATVWPQLFEVDNFSDARSIRQRTVLNNNFNGTSNINWTSQAFLGTVDAFTWASIGYVFSLAGDSTKGYAQANYIGPLFVAPYPYAPCYVADAGWLMMNMSLKFPATNCGLATMVQKVDYNEQTILIYPNPTTNHLSISGHNLLLNSEIIITNIIGETVIKNIIQDEMTIINTSKLLKGFYTLSISKDRKVLIQKKIIIE